MFLKNKIVLACLAVVSLFGNHIVAYAGSAQATTSVNVRTGPGTNFNVIDKLAAHEKVDATECYKSAWCYVKHEGANGWVSSKYLTAVRPKGSANSGQNCRFVFKLDNNGPTFKMECDELDDYADEDELPIFNPNQNARAPKACLYTGINFTGAEICQGISTHEHLKGMDDVFASVKLYNGAAIQLCTGTAFRGECRSYNQDSARLHTNIYKNASSMKIFSQYKSTMLKPRLPNEDRFIPNRKVKRIVLRQNQKLDLDKGKIRAAGADLQYARASNGHLYLRALNGARLSIGKSDNGGFKVCKNARYNRQQIRKDKLPAGSYICVKTNDKHMAQVWIKRYGNAQVNIEIETLN